jgi:hypothetical protein
MRLEIDGRVVATATERAGGCWEVTDWPRFFDRNRAHHRADHDRAPWSAARGSNDLLVSALRDELR